MAEAKRITRPGGIVVVADTDWGSLMIVPGDRDLIRRFKVAMETGPMAEPWAGRILHGAMLDADEKSTQFGIEQQNNAHPLGYAGRKVPRTWRTASLAQRVAQMNSH